MALAAAQRIDAIAALLVPVALSGGRVYTSRLWPLTVNELPAWKVFADEEQIDSATIHATEHHSLGVFAKGFVRASADLDDAMNNLAAAALTALFNPTPAFDLRCEGIERDPSTEAGADVGVVTLHLRSEFFTAQNAPETIL